MRTIEILESFGTDPNFNPTALNSEDRIAFKQFIMNQPGFHAPMLTPAEDDTDGDSEETDPDNGSEKN